MESEQSRPFFNAEEFGAEESACMICGDTPKSRSQWGHLVCDGELCRRRAIQQIEREPVSCEVCDKSMKKSRFDRDGLGIFYYCPDENCEADYEQFVQNLTLDIGLGSRGSWDAEEYGAEWGNHRLDGDGYCEVCDAYGLNCIEQGGNSPESIAAVEEAIRNLENSLQSLKQAGVTDMRELKSAIKQAKLKMYSMMNENRCTCDREYGEADPDCMACLNEWRNQRYGPDIHDVECVCNECVPMGRYSSYAESYEAEQQGDIWDYLVVEEQPKNRKKVRTMTGKPHTPRKLNKDQDITPKEAAKRVKLEAENKKDETVVDKTEESGITTETRQYKKKKYNPDKMKTDIPADVLNQTDSDDFWVAICAGILGIGIGASIERIYGSYRR